MAIWTDLDDDNVNRVIVELNLSSLLDIDDVKADEATQRPCRGCCDLVAGSRRNVKLPKSTFTALHAWCLFSTKSPCPVTNIVLCAECECPLRSKQFFFRMSQEMENVGARLPSSKSIGRHAASSGLCGCKQTNGCPVCDASRSNQVIVIFARLCLQE